MCVLLIGLQVYVRLRPKKPGDTVIPTAFEGAE
jgi:hypothetical protein